MRVLLTGASGFIGQHLARLLTSRGHEVTALVRPTSVRTELLRAQVRFAVGDLGTGEGVGEAVAGSDPEWVFHLAGVIKGRTTADYFRGNAHSTRHLYEAVARQEAPARVVYCSSLAAAGPTTAGKPRREEDRAAPISAYGQSKLAAEQIVRQYVGRVSSVIVRPPLVYGPADKEFIPTLLPFVRLGVVLKTGKGPKHYSLIHVEDLCEVLIRAAEQGRCLSSDSVVDGLYHVSDGREYTWEEVFHTMARALGRSAGPVIPVPHVVSYAAVMGAQLHGLLKNTVPVLNFDKLRDMRAEAWTCTTDRACNEIAYRPAFTLDQGFRQTVAWYRQEGLL